MNEPKIGYFVDGDLPQRDAIHVAVLPVIAGERLVVGQSVEFVPGSTDTVRAADQYSRIGIVDPYLSSYRDEILEGHKFWMFLNPQSITSLRHDWTHPLIDRTAKSDKEASRAWIEQFAKELCQTYERLMDDARDFNDNEDYIYDNSERYKEVDYTKWKLFWHHYGVVAGETIQRDGDQCPYTCSC